MYISHNPFRRVGLTPAKLPAVIPIVQEGTRGFDEFSEKMESFLPAFIDANEEDQVKIYIITFI
jgi:hypothetical protein